MIYIYVLLKNNIPFYVGYTKDPKSRKRRHRRDFGKDIEYLILDEVKQDEKKFWESFWIKQTKSWGFILNNKNSGGGGCLYFSDEVKRKMSFKAKNRKPRTESHKLNLSKSLKNRIFSEETRNKISLSSKGRKVSEEKRKNMRVPRIFSDEAKIRIKSRQNIPIIQYDLEGNFIKEWESIDEAAKNLGKSYSCSGSISSCCQNKLKTAFKFKWKYKKQKSYE
jgi:hypothetical protein